MSTKSSVLIRRAELGDLPIITEIYNEAILDWPGATPPRIWRNLHRGATRGAAR